MESWDIPASLLDTLNDGECCQFTLKTHQGDLDLNLQKQDDHLLVLAKSYDPHQNISHENYHNDLSELIHVKGEITIWPQGTLHLGENVVIGRDMIFHWE